MARKEKQVRKTHTIVFSYVANMVYVEYWKAHSLITCERLFS